MKEIVISLNEERKQIEVHSENTTTLMKFANLEITDREFYVTGILRMVRFHLQYTLIPKKVTSK